jgi:hypothetical protein
MTAFAKISQRKDKVRQNKHLKRSTIVKNVRQIGLFLQNKANLYDTKISASSFVTS